jgi:ABC-2 type transport system permease protein
MNVYTVYALFLRYVYLYGRSPIRLVEMVFWPIVDLLVWGNLTIFLQRNSTPDFASFLMFLMGGMILWDILFRAQQGVAISFLEDVWTRNLLNVFVAPVRNLEYLLATFLVGFLRIGVTCVTLFVVAYLGYSFNLFKMHWWLIPFFANLMWFGWSLGMISTALILRWGQAAESLAWAVPFFIQPVVAVFYPVQDMPKWVQPIANAMPATHVFEGMRELLKTGTVSVNLLWTAVGLNIIYFILAGTLFQWVLNETKRRGLLSKFASQ